MYHTSYSLQETRQLAREILRRLGAKHIILLQGELGSGKTVLAQALAEELGVKEMVNSPTYVLMKVYQANHKHFKRFVHVDLYRVEYDQHLDDLGLSDYLADKKSLVVVEWPERVIGTWPRDSFWVRFYFGDKSDIRIIDF